MKFTLLLSALLISNTAQAGLLEKVDQMRCKTTATSYILKLTRSRLGVGNPEIEIYKQGTWKNWCPEPYKLEVEDLLVKCISSRESFISKGTKVTSIFYADFKSLESATKDYIPNEKGELIESDYALASGFYAQCEKMTSE
jgi:hypothetical protein